MPTPQGVRSCPGGVRAWLSEGLRVARLDSAEEVLRMIFVSHVLPDFEASAFTVHNLIHEITQRIPKPGAITKPKRF
jgi:hypothetical protein